MRYISHETQTEEQTAERIRGFLRQWERDGWGPWAIELTVTGALIGMGGFVRPREIGYVLDEPYWGRGLATELAAACLEFGFNTLELEQIEAGALLENIASRRVLEKCGMRQAPNEYFDSNGGIYYAITQAEYLARANP
jgi:ribosomal-protein-alanine N-acetyltransferase